eukprot:11108893-Alexandrium_andersonii.AAC.1
MSASLVGSEMCIRDRREPLHCNSSQALRLWSRRTARSASGARVLIPVSYTHLTLPTICSV